MAIKFAPDNTQAMLLSRYQENVSQVRGKLKFGRDTIPLQDSINILGVEVDSRLRFDCHFQNGSRKVTLLHRMKHLFHADGPG